MCKCSEPNYHAVNPDPAQMRLTMLCPIEHESYTDGLNTGLEWNASWMPGGPHIYTYNSGFYIDPKKQAMADQSQRQHDAWKDGFKDGLAQRLQNNVRFAAWWNEHRNKHGYHRYFEERPEPELTTTS